MPKDQSTVVECGTSPVFLTARCRLRCPVARGGSAGTGSPRPVGVRARVDGVRCRPPGRGRHGRAGSVLFREDLHAPRSGPPSGAERRDYSGKVERSLSAVAATVDRVLEQCSNDLGVGVVEFDPDDPVQRNGGEVRDGRVGAFDVPDVDDHACRVVPGILDEPQAVVQGLDVRPWEELEPEPCPDAIGLRRELGELRRPVVGVPWGVVAVGGHLDVSRPERLGGGEECVADPVGLLPPGPVVPPVRDPLELEVHDAVVVEHRPDPREAVFLLGCRKVRRQEPEAGEPGCGHRLEPLAQGQRTAQVGTVGGSVACTAPASGQEAVPRTSRAAWLAHHVFAPLLCEVRSRWRPGAGECGGDTRVSPPSRSQRWSSCESSASSWPPAISVVSSSRVTSERFLSSTRRPSLRMMKWSPTRKAWCGLWVMKTTPRPASRAAAVYLSTTPDCLTPSAAVGSSRMSTRAPKYTARAIATHWRWPPESVPIGWLMSLTKMPIFCSSWSAISRMALMSSGAIGYLPLRISEPRKKLRQTSIRPTTARSW